MGVRATLRDIDRIMFKFDKDRDGVLNYVEFSNVITPKDETLSKEICKRVPLDFEILYRYAELALMDNTRLALREMFQTLVDFVNDY